MRHVTVSRRVARRWAGPRRRLHRRVGLTLTRVSRDRQQAGGEAEAAWAVCDTVVQADEYRPLGRMAL
jgi:hypothetical protein